ncbi:uncharacterized protein N0V89_003621 [Didymosphaeria variabile]|uniref:Nucleolar 27S pre-rRNA processing Urb2/Npa2 C-terminal domain-containing protein n=1 Tax=Didymosphaeria variabile TaxID=1932322 RepID=A0A9W9CCW3_9PLEO|nr:uncharacterized protein N0V89_003621 [Didymosphaeria variabile]KAJ4355601.1 hypothetical protein N0V89_003621 [Didymosphaeria variabile]
MSQATTSLPASTRPRLQAINQDYTDLNEQIHQATHIIGLPDDWETLTGDARSNTAKRVVCARADWVLRWILEKMKDTADGGAESRASAKAWKLLDWMVEILPVSRCAPHLRDAGFLTILEKVLEERYGADATIQPEPVHQGRHPRDDSSETVQEDPQPSRKRKRGSGASTPSKRTAIESAGSLALFDAVTTTVRSIRDKGDGQAKSEVTIQSEHMKMVLRTESAQAARILKHWLNAVQWIQSSRQGASGLDDYLDLSLIVEIWELRAIDSKDNSGASVEQFSTECLIPSLLLSEALHQPITDGSRQSDHRVTLSILDRLIVKHILMPSRTAFFNVSTDKGTKQHEGSAELLSSSLEPLSAKLLQAAQIQDGGVKMPAYFTALFAAAPHLLHLIIRSSPARSPKARTTEKPWIQAALVALAQCVGCSMEPPEFAAPRASIAAIEECITILASHSISIETQVLRDVFWFHSGLKYPLDQKNIVNWPLIAALVKTDASIFLADPKATPPSPDGRPSDLAAFLFEHVPAANFENHNLNDDDSDHAAVARAVLGSNEVFSRDDVVQKIVVPIVHTFSRNRQLLGFIELWDEELRRTMPASRDPLTEMQPRIWEDRHLILALAEVFEQSLTLTQITTLFQKHAERLEQSTTKHLKKALSSAVIIQAMLRSIKSDQIIEALRPAMLIVWKVYDAWVQDDGPSQSPALELAWSSLCFLLGHLWPIYFHESAVLQKELIQPLLDRASKDANSARKEESNRRLPSSCRTAAVVFVFVACDYLLTVPDTAEVIQKRLQKTLKAMGHSQIEPQELSTTLELFCIEYAQLLAAFDANATQKVLSRLLETISEFDVHLGGPLIETLSASIFKQGNAVVEASFVSVLMNVLDQTDENLRTTSMDALLHISPTSLSREQREAVLDKLLGLLTTAPTAAAPILNIMINLMQVPNATAKVSADGKALFDIAKALHEAELELLPTTQLLQDLVQMTLGHLTPNKDQAQNKVFFTQFGDQIASALKESTTCSPARLAVLSGALLATQEWGSFLPPKQYLDFLSNAINKWPTSQKTVLGAYNQIPPSVLRKEDALFDSARKHLQQWIDVQCPTNPLMNIEMLQIDLWPAVFTAIAKYQLYQGLGGTTWLLELASKLLGNPSIQQRDSQLLQCIRETFTPLETSEKLNGAYHCILIAKEGTPPQIAYQLLHSVVAAINDNEEVEADLKARKMALLPQICSLLSEVRGDAAFNALLDTLNTILLHKPNMTSQHNIECVLTTLLKLATRSSPRLSPAHAPAIYARLCETARLVLLLHRSRLGGRFHLLIPVLQSLLLCLFIPNLNRGAALPPWLDSPSPANPTRLTATNAAQYTHLLSTLCSPTQSSVQRTRSATTLNDPIKAAREYASQYVYPLLSSFCRFQLYGRLDAEVREKLMPGIWELVSVGQLNKEAIDAMFAGLGRSERDVWRGVWGEWVRVHGRKERKVKEER